MTMCRSTVTVSLLWFCLALPFCYALEYDSDNPVDLYGPDGLAFTGDDPLLVRAGYMNSGVFACAASRRKNGTAAGADMAENVIRIGAWVPTKNMIYTAQIGDTYQDYWYREQELTPMFPDLPAPPHYFDFELEKFYEVGDGSNKPEFYVLPDVPTNADWWKGPDNRPGCNLRVSFMHFANAELDGDMSPSSMNARDPAIKCCPNHLDGLEDYLDDVFVEKAALDIGVLSITNMKNAKTGICGRGFARCLGGEIYINSSIDVHKYGITVSVRIKPTSIGRRYGKNPGTLKVQKWGITFWKVKITESLARDWVNNVRREVRNNSNPDFPEHISGDRLNRFHRSWSSQYKRGGNGFVNACLEAVMQEGRWLPWLETDDLLTIKDNEAFDLSGTKLDGPVNVSTPILEDTTIVQNGFSFSNVDILLYGRNRQKRFSRLIECFACNWLCLNMTVFKPYDDSSGSAFSTQAKWDYYDLICDKLLTEDSYDVPWPLAGGKGWYGGQGMILGAQCAAGHDGQGGNDEMSCNPPGSPESVDALIITFVPEGNEDGDAVFNFYGVSLQPGLVCEYDPSPDPVGEGFTLTWSGTPVDESGPIKFFYTNVSNGYDRQVASGTFDFKLNIGLDNSIETDIANVSYNLDLVPNHNNIAAAWITDRVTGRTGCQVFEIE